MLYQRYWRSMGVAGAILAVTVVSAFAAEKEVELADGNKLQAEYGHITVPERRDRADSGEITLPYVKLLAKGD